MSVTAIPALKRLNSFTLNKKFIGLDGLGQNHILIVLYLFVLF